MEKILIVDHEVINCNQLKEILRDEYDVETASDVNDMNSIMDMCAKDIATVLYRFSMDGLDGYGFLKMLDERGLLERIPVLFINERGAAELEHGPIRLGVYDFVHKPFVAEIVRRRVSNLTELFIYKRGLEEKVESQSITMNKQFKLLKVQKEELNRSKQNIVDILATVVECRSLESGDHINRIKGYTEIIARRMMKDYPETKLTESDVDIIVSASALHDIGKIAIPDSILNKPGKLTDDEFEFMKSHTIRGADIVNNISGIWDEDYARICYEICRYHHERYDGRGYPDKIKGDDIPISAQCESIADVYDALVTESVYRAAYSKDEAFNMIVQGEAGVFSPRLLECFRKSREEFEAFLGEHNN
ncbi:MAG: HD domain-containing protein [Lachnospiraceae bacterium]|nr:HD domain-containing protein [Lachnospiraceae bacterium]MBR5765958.1 HD domain-containing protein [Lachnospiraceae bacterium]